MARPTTYRHWSPEETDRLIKMWDAKLRIEDIALELHRTYDSITSKVAVLDLDPHRPGRKLRHALHQLRPNQSILLPLAQARRKSWHDAARYAGIKITTRLRMLKGEPCYRITRLAA